MKIEAHILCFQEAEIIGYSCRHYMTFCDRVIVHDLGSHDDSRVLARCEGAEIVQHDCKGEFDDRLNQSIKNTCWVGSDSDWVVICDADEFFYAPHGMFATLSAYDHQDLPVVKTHGFEMFSDTFPQTERQLYDDIKDGTPDDLWYSKPLALSPKRVQSASFSMGAHWVEVALKNGQRFATVQGAVGFSDPPAWTLHFKHLGGVERMARLYDENYKRQCANNHLHHFGNQKSGIVHANEKRAMILSKLRRVIQ